MPRPAKPEPPPCDAALLEVRRQQEASLASFQLLQEQHSQWQQAVEELLSQVQANVDNDAVEAPPRFYKREVSEDPSTNSHLLNNPSERSHGTATLGKMSRSPAFQVQENSPLKKIVNEMLEEAHMATEASVEQKSCCAQLRDRCRGIVEAQWFEYVTGAVILMNMITICIEVEVSIDKGPSPWAQEVERCFWILYTVELLFRIMAHGLSNIWNPWFILDAFLVIVGFIALVVVPIFDGMGTGDGFPFEKLLVVRGLRLLRLVRALRMVRHFKVMWRLVYSLLTAGQTMLSMTALIMLALMIFGCMAVELIRNDEDLKTHPDTTDVVLNYFGNLPSSILTLLQFVTVDSVAAIYYPLILHRPDLILYFSPIIVIVSIGLMNLVTAVLVESALESAQQEAEAGRQELKQKIKGALPSLLDIFQTLDADMSGFITRDEIDAVPVDVLPASVLESLPIDNMQELFEMLDVDGTGTLTLQEFVEGLMNLALLDVPIWTIQSQRMLRSVRTLAMKIDQDIQSLKSPGISSKTLHQLQPQARVP